MAEAEPGHQEPAGIGFRQSLQSRMSSFILIYQTARGRVEERTEREREGGRQDSSGGLYQRERERVRQQRGREDREEHCIAEMYFQCPALPGAVLYSVGAGRLSVLFPQTCGR